jgi:predicted permease
MHLHTEEAMITAILICFGVVLTAFIVAAFGTCVCVGVILFTDAENDQQMMATLRVLWWIQTVAFIFGIIYLCCNYMGYCDRIMLNNNAETDRHRRKKHFIYAICVLVSEMVDICVAPLLFANVGNNQQWMTVLLVLWSIEVVMIIIACTSCCFICFFCPHYIRSTEEERTPVVLKDRQRNRRPAKV